MEKENQDENSNNGNVAAASVFERTKDLLEEEPSEPMAEKGGVDWGWGDEEENDDEADRGDDDPDDAGETASNANIATATASNNVVANNDQHHQDEEEDSDATAEMDSDGEDETMMLDPVTWNASVEVAVAITTTASSPVKEDVTPATATPSPAAAESDDEQVVSRPPEEKEERDSDLLPSSKEPAAADTDEDDDESAQPTAAFAAAAAPKKKLVLYESSGEDSDGGMDMEVEDSDDDDEKDGGEEEEDAVSTASAKDQPSSTEEPDTPASPKYKVSKDDDEKEEDSSPTSRRSSRARRKPKQLQEASSDEEEEEEVPPARRPRRSAKKAATKRVPARKKDTSEADDEEEDDDADDEAEEEKRPETPPKPKITKKVAYGSEQLDEDDLLRSTDYLFLEANKDTVTVADICRALSAEYDCKLSKANKKLIRGHLIDLMKGNVQPQVASSEQEQGNGDEGSQPEEEEEEDQVSEQGDLESEQSEFEQAADSEDEDVKPKKSRKTKAKKATTKQPKKPKLKRPSQRKAAKAARMVEAERLRKKRMEELRVRNEEMQLNESKEEQERAEAIAARFETNTDEHRLKRLEDRLTLLELLDKKRIAVIDALESKIEQKDAAAAAKNEEPDREIKAENSEEEDEEQSESSSDEEELDIVGASNTFKPLKPIHTHFPSQALNILKQVRTPQAKKATVAPKAKSQVRMSPAQLFKANASPSKSKGGRNNLRQALRQKQRKQGNLWLARELGYKNEEEHLKDCNSVVEGKRALVQKLEQARVEANERRLLRERILRQENGVLPEDGEDNESEKAEGGNNSPDDEEDEEMQMAREIELAHRESESSAENAGEHEEEVDIGANDTAPKTGFAQATSAQSEESESSRTALLDEEVDESAGFPTEDDTQDEESPQWETQAPVLPTNTQGEPNLSKKDGQNDTEGLSKDDAKSSVGVEISEEKQSSSPEGESEGKSEEKSDPLADDSDEGELEFLDEKPKKDPNRPRNAGWQAMLEKEAAMLKKQKKRKPGLIEDQAEEEEEEEVAGLEDFGFSVKKKKQDDEDEDIDDKLDEDDLKHVVDDVSDNEGDEEAGEAARKKQERLEEKEQHKAILRRMREGYDGRRGGIAGSGVGARGMHRFDQLVAADNREDAKRLGLLNDDELDTDDENEKKDEKSNEDEDDEAALLDKMLKDRFLHRTDIDIEENFSEDEEDPEETNDKGDGDDSEAEEERTQERLAKRFAKRARMQRLEEEYADSQEFSQQRLIDEDESMRQELSQMKNGLVRKRSVSSSTRSSVSSEDSSSNMGHKRPRVATMGGSFLEKTGGSSLSIALRASRKVQLRTSFLGGDKAGKAKESGALIHKSVALSHVTFGSTIRGSLSASGSNMGEATGKRKRVTPGPASSSLFQKVARKVQ